MPPSIGPVAHRPTARRGFQIMSAACMSAALLIPASSLAAPAPAEVAPPKPVQQYGLLTGAKLTPLSSALLRPDGAFGEIHASDTAPLELLEFDATSSTIKRTEFPGTTGAHPDAVGGTLSGVDGLDWLIVGQRVVGIDDLGRLTKTVGFPAGATPITLLATGRGLRVLLRQANGGPVSVADTRGRVIATLPLTAGLGNAVASADGGVVISARFAPKKSDEFANLGLLRVSANGTIKKTLLPKAARGRWTSNVAAAVSGGTLLVNDDGESRFAAFANLRPGEPPIRRTVQQLQFPRNEACRTRVEFYEINWAIAGPSGNPIASISCLDSSNEPGRTYDVLQQIIVGLTAELRVRWFTTPGAQIGGGQLVIGGDGRLFTSVPGTESPQSYSDPGPQLLAMAAPDARRIGRGQLQGLSSDDRGPVATITCDRPNGTVCTGVAQLKRDGKVVATANYALLGRPGREAAMIRRHFDGAQADGELTVSLLPRP